MIPVSFSSEKSEKYGHEVRKSVVSGRLRGAYFGFNPLLHNVPKWSDTL